ncbi:hypothetical protein L596_030508 [Steinernema carpocapsae]|uniref:Uncharacterized protein n=1 Tax=Steinernema carpocapsae TaxID=34508 RepID=A0A4U5LPM1_STECR|nr:hypothetical protein L596_030508 [Steinernema carpocapsae]
MTPLGKFQSTLSMTEDYGFSLFLETVRKTGKAGFNKKMIFWNPLLSLQNRHQRLHIIVAILVINTDRRQWSQL